MKVLGIIAEYNPFHNGHKYHIEKAKTETGADAVAVVMSGSFVQRGEPAIYSKHRRAAAAVSEGADLVLELPTYFSLKSAEGFAFGAVKTLTATGCVDYLSFGTECGDLSALSTVSQVLQNETPEFKLALSDALSSGLSFAASREKAVSAVLPQYVDLLKAPNNILGIEYLKALSGSTITPHTIKRESVMHDSNCICGHYASASHLREMIKKAEPVPEYIPKLIDETPLFLENFEPFILYALTVCDDISLYPDTGDGLAQRIEKASKHSLSLLLEETKTRRITLSRIKRVLMNILLHNNLHANLMPEYIRVLAFNQIGTSILRLAKSRTSLPIITKPSLYTQNSLIWELECRATAIRALAGGNSASEYTLSPICL